MANNVVPDQKALLRAVHLKQAYCQVLKVNKETNLRELLHIDNF